MDGQDSDHDMFDNDQPTETTGLQYGYLILFDWSTGAKTRFHIYMTHEFRENEIRDSWIQSILSDKLRNLQLKPMEVCSSKKMSLFAKVESSKNFITFNFNN